jgi:hypothetical protein
MHAAQVWKPAIQQTWKSNAARICFQTSPAKTGHIIVPEGYTIIAQRFNLRNAPQVPKLCENP